MLMYEHGQCPILSRVINLIRGAIRAAGFGGLAVAAAVGMQAFPGSILGA